MKLDITLVILSLAGIAVGLLIGFFFQKGKNAKIRKNKRRKNASGKRAFY